MHSFPASFQFSWPVTSCPSWNNPEAPPAVTSTAHFWTRRSRSFTLHTTRGSWATESQYQGAINRAVQTSHSTVHQRHTVRHQTAKTKTARQCRKSCGRAFQLKKTKTVCCQNNLFAEQQNAGGQLDSELKNIVPSEVSLRPRTRVFLECIILHNTNAII